MKREVGMTLIELLIVVIVLGIIAAVAAPRFVDVSSNAMAVGKSGSIGAFKSALTIAIAEQQTTQPTWAHIEANIVGFSNPAAGTVAIDLDGDSLNDVIITGYSDASCLTLHTDGTEGSATLSWNDGMSCFNL